MSRSGPSDLTACYGRQNRHGVTVGVLLGHCSNGSHYCLLSIDRSLIELRSDWTRGDHASTKIGRCRKGRHQLNTVDPDSDESGRIEKRC